MILRAVTCFVPIEGHPRSVEEFHWFGSQLKCALGPRLMVAEGDLDHCWLYRNLDGLKRFHGDLTHSIADNPRKNSLAYHCVNAQKTECLVGASKADPLAEVFVWIDYAIFHIPGVTAEILNSFLERAENERAIAIPGCWERGKFVYDDNYPCWRFCGGVMVVPRGYIETFDHAMKHEYVEWISKTGNVSWEVNTLARLETNDPEFPVWWYKADHDQTMFTNYRATVDNADRRIGWHPHP